MDAVATGNQLPNPQTLFFSYYLRIQRNHTLPFCSTTLHIVLFLRWGHSSAGSFLWSYISNRRYLHFQFSLHIPVWSSTCSSYPLALALFFCLSQTLTGSVFLNWIIKLKNTKQKEIMMITLLHILKALFRNSTFPRLHSKTHFFALSDCPQ